MSTKRGGAPKGPPKHQNRRAYKPFQDVKKNPKEPGGSDGQSFAPIAGVCMRCKEQLEWRRKYGKYKPLVEPTKCIWCQKRNVRMAYHAICSACANAKGACGKCCKQVNHIVGKDAEQEEAERRQLEEALSGMRERDRRTLLRAMEKGTTVRKSESASAGEEDSDASSDCLDSETDEGNEASTSGEKEPASTSERAHVEQGSRIAGNGDQEVSGCESEGDSHQVEGNDRDGIFSEVIDGDWRKSRESEEVAKRVKAVELDTNQGEEQRVELVSTEGPSISENLETNRLETAGG